MLPMCVQVALIINGKVRSFFLALHPLTPSPPHPFTPSLPDLNLSQTQSLGFALDDSIKEKFLELSLACKSVICCRYTSSPSFLLPPSFLLLLPSHTYLHTE